MKDVVHYNIEYCHIYYGSNPLISKENLRTIKKTKELISLLDAREKEYSLCILVDTSISGGYDPDKIYKELKNVGLTPDFIVDEHIFSSIANEIILKIPTKNKLIKNNKIFFTERLKKRNTEIELMEKQKENNVYTCPLLSTAWQLTRLGKFQIPKVPERKFKCYSSKPFVGINTFTIIEKKFMKVEYQVFNVIDSIKSFEKLNKRIFYLF